MIAAQHNTRIRSGFTLVELSIVLVILGLLVGGVLAGQSLIHAAELRAVTAEYDKYEIAMGAFRDKYFAVPGDMPNAVRYWGLAPGGSSSEDGVDSSCVNITAASTTQATCNGSGDGRIASLDGSPDNAPHEAFRAWQHLANAGLVEGAFTGVHGSGGNYHAVRGVNIPASKFPQGGWSFYWLPSDTSGYYGGIAFYAADYRNVYFFGANTPTTLPLNPVMKAEDAYNLDMKIDDGKPNAGTIMGRPNAYATHCVDSSNAYMLSDTTIGCMLIFRSKW